MHDGNMQVAVLLFAALVLVYGDHVQRVLELPRCPRGFLKLGSFCLKLDTQPRNWPEAVKYCQSIKANLATLENASKMRLLTSYLMFENRNLHYDMSMSHIEGNFWTGGFYRRSLNVTEEGWFWTAKVVKNRLNRKGKDQNIPEQAFQYYPQKDKQNIVQKKLGDAPKDCLMIRKDGVWTNYYCFGLLGTVCEIPFKT